MCYTGLADIVDYCEALTKSLEGIAGTTLLDHGPHHLMYLCKK